MANQQTDAIRQIELVTDPISRTQLALYCGGSGDHNPIHIDFEAAKAAGLPDVIAHGMLSAAFLGRMLTDAAGPTSVRRLKVRFGAMSQIGDIVHCTGRITNTDTGHAEVEVLAVSGGKTTLSGSATIVVAADRI
jgi:acyl dehydratase